jgi:hypothetical protein
VTTRPEQTYTERAAAAVILAVREEPDFGGWLAEVLAIAAAEIGSSDALTAGRPGSWEADLVNRLVKAQSAGTTTISRPTRERLGHESNQPRAKR